MYIMDLYNGDCLEVLKDLSDNSIDFICSDLPYGRFKHLEWDKRIDLEKMWKQLWRVAKPNCPIFLFGDFKFAVELYNSEPKHFKYEIVWNKGQTTTPLLSRKRFGRATEYILAFYKNQPVYNYAKYHKIVQKQTPSIIKDGINKWEGRDKTKKANGYEPTLPINIIENDVVFSSMVMGKNNNMYHSKSGKYEPRLPTNVIENDVVIDKYSHLNHRGNKLSGKCNTYEPTLPTNVIKCKTKRNNKTIKKLTEKPQFVLEHLLKYFSNEGDTCLDICMGSGSLGVACNTLNRKFIGIEKDKEFFSITKERLNKLPK